MNISYVRKPSSPAKSSLALAACHARSFMTYTKSIIIIKLREVSKPPLRIFFFTEVN